MRLPAALFGCKRDAAGSRMSDIAHWIKAKPVCGTFGTRFDGWDITWPVTRLIYVSNGYQHIWYYIRYCGD